MNTIVIAGIKRSGSTVQYNLVRIALEHAGYTINIHGQSYNPRVTPSDEVDIVKLHPFREHIADHADHIFLTNRNPKSIKESLERFNNDSQSYDRFFRFYKDFIQWCLYTDPAHYQTYSKWVGDKVGFTEEIVDALELAVDPVEVLQEFEKIEPPESGQDPVTLMHHNHITK